MRKLFKKLNENRGIVISLTLMILCVFFGAQGVMMAEVTTVAPGTPSATTGQQGLSTQVPGESTTVSNAEEAGGDLIQPEIDEEITQIASDESVIDTIKRRVKRQVRVSSFVVEHYMIDEKRSSAKTISAYTNDGNAERAELKLSANDAKLFQEYYTVLLKGVNGYDSTGQTKLEADLMCYVVSQNETNNMPIIIAINGPKANSKDASCYVPNIPAGTEIILLSSAGYETQKYIAPNTILPTPEIVYLQKQLCNNIVSDYFDAQKKKIPFQKATIAEAMLRQFRLESCRTAWVGQKGKIKVASQDKTLGKQDVYFSQGVRWQIKRQYDLSEKITLDDLINLSMVKFTGLNCSKTAVWLLGKLLMADIQKIDLTLHKDISMADSEVFGIKCTKIKTVFGDINLVHDPALDRLGYSKCGALLDEQGLVRYWMKNEESNSENVQGEEAKRDVVMTIDCLCLKGFSHIWVDGSATHSDIPGAAKVVSSATLPQSPTEGDVVILSAAAGNFAKGDIVTWSGSAWVAYTGELLANKA